MHYLRKLANDAVLTHRRQDTHDEDLLGEAPGYKSHLTNVRTVNTPQIK